MTELNHGQRTWDMPFGDGQPVVMDAPFTNISRALWVGTPGHVSAITNGGQTLIFKNVSGLLPGRFSQVTSANTTATDIVAVW